MTGASGKRHPPRGEAPFTPACDPPGQSAGFERSGSDRVAVGRATEVHSLDASKADSRGRPLMAGTASSRPRPTAVLRGERLVGQRQLSGSLGNRKSRPLAVMASARTSTRQQPVSKYSRHKADGHSKVLILQSGRSKAGGVRRHWMRVLLPQVDQPNRCWRPTPDIHLAVLVVAKRSGGTGLLAQRLSVSGHLSFGPPPSRRTHAPEVTAAGDAGTAPTPAWVPSGACPTPRAACRPRVAARRDSAATG